MAESFDAAGSVVSLTGLAMIEVEWQAYGGPILPDKTLWSLWHTPHAWTLISISPSLTSNIGMSLICSGSLTLVMTAALNDFGRGEVILRIPSLQSISRKDGVYEVREMLPLPDQELPPLIQRTFRPSKRT